MEVKAFVDKVKMHFGFLERDYMFQVILADNSDIQRQTDGLVKFASSTTLIAIGSEMGQIAVKLVRIQDDERYYLDPVSIDEYLKTNDEEKKVLLSKDINDQALARAVFNKIFLLFSPEWKSNAENISGVEGQLINYANWLKAHASLCLMGDFSRWPEFYEYKINRMIADELRQGGKAVVKAVIKDENGKLKTIERPIFQREINHLAQMQKEISNKK